MEIFCENINGPPYNIINVADQMIELFDHPALLCLYQTTAHTHQISSVWLPGCGWLNEWMKDEWIDLSFSASPEDVFDVQLDPAAEMDLTRVDSAELWSHKVLIIMKWGNEESS